MDRVHEGKASMLIKRSLWHTVYLSSHSTRLHSVSQDYWGIQILTEVTVPRVSEIQPLYYYLV